MIIERDRVVRFHYALRDEQGHTIESSRGGEPLAVLQGHGNVLPGVEEGLEGRAAGDCFSVTVPPEKGYGKRVEGRVQRVPKKAMANAKRLKPGASAVLSTREGPRSVTVVSSPPWA